MAAAKLTENLEVFANGLRFENPFVLASAPPTATGDLIRNAFEAGWAGAVTKTIKDEDVTSSNVSPRFNVLWSNTTVIGFENIEMVSEEPILYWLQEIKDIKKEYPTKILIASIMGAAGVESWQSIARKTAGAGADALELNFSCPNGVTAQGLGSAIGQDNDIIRIITKGVKEVVNIPVIVKLTPNVTSIASAAKAAVDGGADGLCAINTVLSLVGIDIETLTPLPNVGGYSTYGGLSGSCVKPIGLRCVAEIAKEVKTPANNGHINNISIHAVGGISTWKDSVEYIAVGADVIQICTEVMLKGISIIDKLKSGLAAYMKRKKIEALSDICGAALPKIVTHGQLSRKYKAPARIDYSKCKSCKSCITICKESGANAIYAVDSLVAIDRDKCYGCTLCSFICPTRAIYIAGGFEHEL
ncbi:MAG: NAD-dependent dihydropyrimidine dehydrogenase subunit PreA [bacterium]